MNPYRVNDFDNEKLSWPGPVEDFLEKLSCGPIYLNNKWLTESDVLIIITNYFQEKITDLNNQILMLKERLEKLEENK